jgi:hypothetical protein
MADLTPTTNLDPVMSGIGNAVSSALTPYNIQSTDKGTMNFPGVSNPLQPVDQTGKSQATNLTPSTTTPATPATPVAPAKTSGTTGTTGTTGGVAASVAPTTPSNLAVSSLSKGNTYNYQGVTDPAARAKIDAGLMAAMDRNSNGTITPQDKVNLDYAMKNGWQPNYGQTNTNQNGGADGGTGSGTAGDQTKLGPDGKPIVTGTGDQKPAATSDNDKILLINSGLQSGLATADEIANSKDAQDMGLTVDEVNRLVGSNTQLQKSMQFNTDKIKMNEDKVALQNKLKDLNNGIFTLSADEQAQVDDMQKKYDRLEQLQLTANKNFEGATDTNEIMSGRQEFMNQISTGAHQQAISDGIQKISDIEQAAASNIAALKQNLKDKDYAAVERNYELLNSQITDKTQTINDMAKSVTDLYKTTAETMKAAQDATTASLNQQKLTQEVTKGQMAQYAPQIAAALTGDATKDQSTLEEWAKVLGTDSATIFGATEAYKQSTPDAKTQANLVEKGYKEVAAGTEGATVVGKKSYLAPDSFKDITEKGITTTYRRDPKTGSLVKVGSVGTYSGGSGTGSTTDQKTAQANIQSDMDNLVITGQKLDGTPMYDTVAYNQMHQAVATSQPKLLKWFEDAYPKPTTD